MRKCAHRAGMRSAAPSPPQSNSPTAEFRAHHRLEAPRIDRKNFRQYWRRKSSLSLLFEREAISLEAFQAGRAWRGWCETIGRERVQAWVALIPRAPGPHTPTEHQLGAAGSLQAAARAMGRKRTLLLMLCCVEDESFVAIGRRLGTRRETAKERVIEALEALARWRAGGGGRG